MGNAALNQCSSLCHAVFHLNHESKGEVVRRACPGAIVAVYPSITSHELGVPDYPVCSFSLKGHQQGLKLDVERRMTCRGGRENRKQWHGDGGCPCASEGVRLNISVAVLYATRRGDNQTETCTVTRSSGTHSVIKGMVLVLVRLTTPTFTPIPS